ncbi:selenide, water dikinase SelD [Xinfangfangia pollutisoli]|uniref:selenide, water dikinase SelD n=1 Tax=Xinfangfangia pollutisoli TaxID=2865960 RepID=UPI001CD7AA8F|nr:selenide, water dikinase SelD [Xinfangfangia pollutisoli]
MQAGASFPQVQDIVLIGGGHAHALVLRMWGMRPLPGARLTLINPGPVAPYTGMLPGLIAGHYRRDEIMIDLVRLARFAGAALILDRAVGLDPARREVQFADRPAFAYDIASVDIGIGSDLPEIPGMADHAVAAKPLGRYAEAWQAFLARRLAAPQLVIVGAGVGGVELALASAHRLRGQGARPQITLIERAAAPLPHIGAKARARLLAKAEAAGIAILCNATPAAIAADRVTLSDGRVLASDFTLSVAGGRPQAWLAETGLAVQDGFLTVGPTLQTLDPAVFAAGDCAHLAHAPRPKAGVFAVRAAPVLFHNLRALASGRALRPYHPQRDYLKLVSTGDRGAVADKFGLRAGGGWLWRVKDRIDRRFMAKFEDYPAMARPVVPAEAAKGLEALLQARPLCAGCGAKLGAEALQVALAGLPAPQRPEVIAGPGDDAAVLRLAGGGLQVLTTDHLRGFTGDAHLMARLTAVHALGDIWAMGAAPQSALAQVTLPRLAEPLQARMLGQIMAGASQVIRAAGADLVGGHTTQGDELVIGFSLTGLGDRVVTKAGARPGDAVLLTKALGSGTVLAAEMARAGAPGLILGEAYAACLAQMARPLAPASAILAPWAHAMTDVTGFGLAGHLMEILRASGVAAEIDLGEVPLLPGAETLAAQGQGSSLAPTNRAALGWAVDLPPGPRADLLFDPQTCGGLLACVPEDRAEALLAALHAAGDSVAARIGTITEGAPFLTARR